MGFFVVIITSFWWFFFFQAEDGIRDSSVTGVQTCALPISRWALLNNTRARLSRERAVGPRLHGMERERLPVNGRRLPRFVRKFRSAIPFSFRRWRRFRKHFRRERPLRDRSVPTDRLVFRNRSRRYLQRCLEVREGGSATG